ncbi:LysR family transcriptional regulator [Pseudonocardia zijingensis]|uniref:LysR family transcriptional regulator n=1 Tax=Pseudonocardia zijingensis TaxID=153376 RepID=A0ABP4AVJ7_9PSEU
MAGLEIRELECFLVLAEELHFGRTGERLFVTQSRVSQLIGALERRVGARLVSRTSRRVRLTPLGVRLRDALAPAYDALCAAVDDARDAARTVAGDLRVGFQGTADDRLLAAVTAFQDRHAGSRVEITEIAFSDPFGPVQRGEVDAAVVLLPVEEEELVLGPVFSRQPQRLAVSTRHPLARRGEVAAEELAGVPLICAAEPAGEYWRRAHAPTATPGGQPIPRGPAVSTLQEGVWMIAAGRGGMLLCAPTAAHHRRRDVVDVPVTGLPDTSLGLVWHRDHENARIRAFAEVVAATVP